MFVGVAAWVAALSGSIMTRVCHEVGRLCRQCGNGVEAVLVWL